MCVISPAGTELVVTPAAAAKLRLCFPAETIELGSLAAGLENASCAESLSSVHLILVHGGNPDRSLPSLPLNFVHPRVRALKQCFGSGSILRKQDASDARRTFDLALFERETGGKTCLKPDHNFGQFLCGLK